MDKVQNTIVKKVEKEVVEKLVKIFSLVDKFVKDREYLTSYLDKLYRWSPPIEVLFMKLRIDEDRTRREEGVGFAVYSYTLPTNTYLPIHVSEKINDVLKAFVAHKTLSSFLNMSRKYEKLKEMSTYYMYNQIVIGKNTLWIGSTYTLTFYCYSRATGDYAPTEIVESDYIPRIPLDRVLKNVFSIL